MPYGDIRDWTPLDLVKIGGGLCALTLAMLGAARNALAVEDLDAYFRQVRKSIGPPWRKDHKVAMAAAIVAANARQHTG